MRIKLLLLTIVITLFCSCRNWDNYDDPEKKATVTVANPLTIAQIPFTNSFVGVEVTVIVNAMNASTNQITTYSSKTKHVAPNNFGTPGFIDVKGVSIPENGPLSIQVMLKAKDCNKFFVTDCYGEYGGKQKYIGSTSFMNNGSSPLTYFVGDRELKYSGSRCCK